MKYMGICAWDNYFIQLKLSKVWLRFKALIFGYKCINEHVKDYKWVVRANFQNSFMC